MYPPGARWNAAGLSLLYLSSQPMCHRVWLHQSKPLSCTRSLLIVTSCNWGLALILNSIIWHALLRGVQLWLETSPSQGAAWVRPSTARGLRLWRLHGMQARVSASSLQVIGWHNVEAWLAKRRWSPICREGSRMV